MRNSRRYKQTTLPRYIGMYLAPKTQAMRTRHVSLKTATNNINDNKNIRKVLSVCLCPLVERSTTNATYIYSGIQSLYTYAWLTCYCVYICKHHTSPYFCIFICILHHAFVCVCMHVHT